ncbi:MAG: peptidase C15 [Cyanobacteria bacterium P01_D01_bin.36]
MATSPLLITTFQPWRAHQPSNSSDDLIAALAERRQLPANSIWIRNVPVSFELAPIRVISELYQHRPHTILCCGMAENRPYLSLEQQAIKGCSVLHTSLDLKQMLQNTQLSQISYNAGSFVCNELYYRILESIQKYKLPTAAVFVHIPILEGARKQLVLEDFMAIANSL